MKNFTLLVIAVLIGVYSGLSTVAAQDQLWPPDAPVGATLSVNEIVLIVVLVVVLAFFGFIFWILLSRYGAAVDRLADATPAWMDELVRDNIGRGLSEVRRITDASKTKVDDELLNAIEAVLPSVLDRVLGARNTPPTPVPPNTWTEVPTTPTGIEAAFTVATTPPAPADAANERVNEAAA